MIIFFGISFRAIIPAAAKIPDCLIPPPKALRLNLAFSINSFLPQSNEPDGADKPLERQKDTESTSLVSSATLLFNAVAALNILAPST